MTVTKQFQRTDSGVTLTLNFVEPKAAFKAGLKRSFDSQMKAEEWLNFNMKPRGDKVECTRLEYIRRRMRDIHNALILK